MATERDYNAFADEAYQIDKARARNENRAPLVKGDILDGTRLSQPYKVLKVEDNNKNGMQAMAVASSANHKNRANRQRTEQKSKDVLDATQTSVQHVSGNMNHSLKGQFGNKAKETLASHNKKLKQLT